MFPGEHQALSVQICLLFDGDAYHDCALSLIATSQVVTGLTSLQAAVQDLARAYIDHTDTVLGRKGEGSSFAQFNLTTKPLGVEAGFFSARGATPAPALAEPPVEGKKRKRAPHDKNAPKRALTPFFLYLQSERAHIGTQLGQSHTAKEVQDEGGKRWREMPDQEKAVSVQCSIL